MSRLQGIEIDNEVFNIDTLDCKNMASKIKGVKLEEDKNVVGYGDMAWVYIDSIEFWFVDGHLFSFQLYEKNKDDKRNIYLIDSENKRIDLKDKNSLISLLYEPEFNDSGIGKFKEFEVFSNVKCRVEKRGGHNHFYYYIVKEDNILVNKTMN
jgi:hypothetical protein